MGDHEDEITGWKWSKDRRNLNWIDEGCDETFWISECIEYFKNKFGYDKRKIEANTTEAGLLDLWVIALQTLRDLYEGRFKSKDQAEDIQLALQDDKDILTILLTRGDKSFVSILPTWQEKKRTTMSIIPFITLVKDMKENDALR